MKAQVNEIKERLQYFTGTEMFYQIPFLKTRFTDGLKYLSEVHILLFKTLQLISFRLKYLDLDKAHFQQVLSTHRFPPHWFLRRHYPRCKACIFLYL